MDFQPRFWRGIVSCFPCASWSSNLHVERFTLLFGLSGIGIVGARDMGQ
jgi:hypothetical protein